MNLAPEPSLVRFHAKAPRKSATPHACRSNTVVALSASMVGATGPATPRPRPDRHRGPTAGMCRRATRSRHPNRRPEAVGGDTPGTRGAPYRGSPLLRGAWFAGRRRPSSGVGKAADRALRRRPSIPVHSPDTARPTGPVPLVRLQPSPFHLVRCSPAHLATPCRCPNRCTPLTAYSQSPSSPS